MSYLVLYTLPLQRSPRPPFDACEAKVSLVGIAWNAYPLTSFPLASSLILCSKHCVIALLACHRHGLQPIMVQHDEVAANHTTCHRVISHFFHIFIVAYSYREWVQLLYVRQCHELYEAYACRGVQAGHGVNSRCL